MIKKIEQTVDFVKLKRNIKNIFSEQAETMFAGADKRLRKRLDKGVDYKGERLEPLKHSTLKIRSARGSSSTKPLIDTGNLYRSITEARKGKQIGVSFNSYGLNQAMGFTTTNHFPLKKGGKVVGWRDYGDGRSIPARRWINPMAMHSGLAVVDEKAKRKLIENIRKHLRGKVVHRF